MQSENSTNSSCHFWKTEFLGGAGKDCSSQCSSSDTQIWEPGPWFLSSRPLLSPAPKCGKNSPWALWLAGGACSPPARWGGWNPHFFKVLQRPLLPLSLSLMLVPFSPITPEEQLGMIGILWEGVLGTSLACQPVPCRVHFCWHLIIFHFHQLSGQLPDRPLNYVWSQSSPADTFLFGPSWLTALGENRYKADWQGRSWESECVQPGTPFHFLHCHWHPKTTPGLLMVLFLRNLNIVNYVLIGTELNTHLHPEHHHACLILSCYQGPVWEGPSFAPIIADTCMTFLVVQMVKNLPAMQETWVWSLGQKETLEKEMATHSSILAGESHGQRSLAGYSPWGCKESDTTERLTLSHFADTSMAFTMCQLQFCLFCMSGLPSLSVLILSLSFW